MAYTNRIALSQSVSEGVLFSSVKFSVRKARTALRGISVRLILQSEAQLLKGGQGTDKTIIANCDTYIYMGGNDVETARSVSVRYNKPLEQVLFMPVGHCWVFTRGSKPIYAEIAERPDLSRDRSLRLECEHTEAINRI